METILVVTIIVAYVMISLLFARCAFRISYVRYLREHREYSDLRYYRPELIDALACEEATGHAIAAGLLWPLLPLVGLFLLLSRFVISPPPPPPLPDSRHIAALEQQLLDEDDERL